MKTKRVRPALVESKDKITLNSIVNDPTFGLGIIIEKHGEECFYNTHSSGGSITTPWERNLGDRLKHYELILISLEDDKIEEGEYLNLAHRVIVQPTDLEWANSNSNNLKKVIARQSQIPQEYISKFIAQYNTGGVEDLEIEMEKCWINSDNVKGNSFTEVAKFESSINDFDAVLIIQPKLTNGFVTIVEKEVINYTEEEVRKLISKALYHFCPKNNYRKEDEIDWEAIFH